MSNEALQSGLDISLSDTEKAWRTITPGSVLARLSVDKVAKVREGVAGNFNTPSSVLKHMVYDDNVSVLQALSYNINTPAESIIILLKKSNKIILEGIAGNPSTPKNILIKLSKSNDERIIERVACNPQASYKIFESLIVKSSSVKILTCVASNVKNVKLIHRLFEILKTKAIEANFDTSINSSSRHVEVSVALSNLGSNPKTPESVMALLLESDYSIVKTGVARNRAAPVHLLKQLRDEGDKYAAAELAYNESLPHELKLEVNFLNKIDYIMSIMHILSDTRTPESFLHELVYKDISKNVADSLSMSKFVTDIEKSYLFLSQGAGDKSDWV